MNALATSTLVAVPSDAGLVMLVAIVVAGILLGGFVARRKQRERVRHKSLLTALQRVAAGDADVRLDDPRSALDPELKEQFDAMARSVQERERGIYALVWSDPDTDLLNQRALEETLRTVQCKGRPLVAIAIGIDRFPQIHSTIGRTLVSAMVNELGRRIAPLAIDSTVSRLSPSVIGFAIDNDDPDGLTAKLAQVLEALQAPAEVAGHKIDVTVTIGYVEAEKSAAPDETIECAVVAVAQARTRHKPMAAFNRSDYGDPAGRLKLMRQMHDAFGNGEMRVHYQPKLAVRSSEIHSAEALIRWHHPVHEYVPPDQFVKVAEETGDIRALTLWVLTTVIAEQDQLDAAGFPIAIFVNISARLLGDSGFAADVLALLGSRASRIGFEITETAVIEDPEDALINLQRFADAGVKIAIDDYGSGMSSLAYLKQLPAHELKIDRMFVADLTSGHREPLLVRSTIDLAHALGLLVTAEGVETLAALALLKVMGCDMIQGHIVAKPMAITDLAAYLASDVKIATAPSAQSLTPLEGYW